MKNYKVYTAASALLVVASAAHAEGPIKPFSASVSYDYLTNKSARNASKGAGFGFGLGYELPTGLIKVPVGILSLDAAWNSHKDGGNKLETSGAQLVLRTPLGEKGKGIALYGGVGVGISHLDSKFSTTITTGGSSGGSTTTTVVRKESKNTLGGKVLVGTTFAEGFFAELSYNFNGSIQGVKADSIGLSIGIKF